MKQYELLPYLLLAVLPLLWGLGLRIIMAGSANIDVGIAQDFLAANSLYTISNKCGGDVPAADRSVRASQAGEGDGSAKLWVWQAGSASV